MNLPPEFFELNLRFAKRITEVSAVDSVTSLLKYTCLYVRLGLGYSFDPTNPVWQAYIIGVSQADDPVAWTYQFYLRHREQTQTLEEFPFGCFSYDVWDDNCIKLHFHNADKPPLRSLSQERMHVRLAELRQMFADIRSNVPNATRVIGGSWLYNLDAYRRLYPPEFVRSAYQRQGKAEYAYMGLWGQFLTWDGRIKQELSHAFLTCLQQQSKLAEVEGCFPFAVLHVQCAVEVFYEFYGIDPRPSA